MAQASAADLPDRKGTPEIIVDGAWWTSGFVEVGGRFFLNQPQKAAMPGFGQSLAKFYEYSDNRPGPFSNVALAAGTNDGVRKIELWGKNIGYKDQAFGLSADHAGLYYFDFNWDQSPHLYGYGNTVFQGVGSNVLWVPTGIATLLRTSPVGGAMWNSLNAASHQIDLGISRDTAAGELRVTPNSDWDVKANFSNMHREGTQVEGVVQNWSTSNPTQVPKPVNDTTKNYGISAEYAGTSWWDKSYTFKLGYTGSMYQNNYKFYLQQNPFCDTTPACASGQPIQMMSLWPDNTMNGVSATLAANLPFKSRYVGTASFTNMQQNQAFLPFTVNPNLVFAGGVPGASLAALPASSLNGNINTYLMNNQITTDISSTVKSKLSYRYYNFDNRTPSIFFPGYIGGDASVVQSPTLFGPGTSGYAPVRSVSVSYVKQNGGAELTWKPVRSLNLGASYGYERYDWKRESVVSTDEHTGKVWADWKPASWVDFKTSALFGRRVANNYDYLDNLGLYQWAPQGTLAKPGNVLYMPNERQYNLTGRERTKFDFQAGVTVLPGVRVTPSFQYINDYMPLAYNPALITAAAFNAPSLFQIGVNWNRTTRSGIDLSYAMNPTTRFFAMYMYEHVSQGVVMGAPGTQALNSSSQMERMSILDNYHTARVGFDTVLFDRFDVKAAYTFAKGKVTQPLAVAFANFMNYQPMDTVLSRFELDTKYTFADDWVRSMGLKGKVIAGLKYAFEQNRVTNWQQTANYVYSAALTQGYGTYLGYDNPNYAVHRLSASLAYKW